MPEGIQNQNPGGDPQNKGQNDVQNNSNTQEKFENFEKFLEKQPAEVKILYENHTTSLRNAVRATRDERDTLFDQVKDLLKKVEKGSDAEKQLTDFQEKLENANKRADFLEEAIKPEIGCRNPKAAFALAETEGLFNSKGRADWVQIKKLAPELFGVPDVQGDAGSGTDHKAIGQDMNSIIRGMAGRKST